LTFASFAQRGQGSIVEAANGDEAVTIDDLMQQIQETERLIAVYRKANEVIVGTQDEIYSRRGLINRTTLTADEIGDQIVRILERRLAALRSDLQKPGAENQGGKPLIMPAG
jgi:hypothetical protein